MRATVLRSHCIEVYTANSLQSGTLPVEPNVYELMFARRAEASSGEALEFCDQSRDSSPEERFAFLVGPPVYLSRTWPREVSAHDASQGQRETVKPFVDAA